MKKLVLLFAFVVLASTASFAQFRGGFMVDYGIPAASTDGTQIDKKAIGDYANGGIGGRLIFRYAVTEKIDAGLEGGFHVFAGASASDDGSTGSFGATAMTSMIATGDYYFTNDRFAPYAGIGLGYGKSVSADASGSGETLNGAALSGTSFAFVPRAGFKFGAFNFDISYNMLLGSASGEAGSVDGSGNTTETDKVSINNSHLRFGIGFIFGSRN